MIYNVLGPLNVTIYKDSSGNWGANIGVGIGIGAGMSFQEINTSVRPYIESSWGK